IRIISAPSRRPSLRFAPKQALASQGSVSPLPVRLVREKRRENQRCESSIHGPSSSSVSGTEIGLSWSVSPSPVLSSPSFLSVSLRRTLRILSSCRGIRSTPLKPQSLNKLNFNPILIYYA
ncbi:unnamed protein product, partial [Prunus brigantina]